MQRYWPRRPWDAWQRRTRAYQQPQPLCYSTPARLAAWMVELLDIQPGQRVLEPSAGEGDLVRAALAACPGASIDVLEIQPALQALLEQEGYRLVGTDFLAYRPGPMYHRIVMNPPFKNGLDIWHILYAFDLLAYGGRLATIAHAESTSGSSARSQAFQLWLRERRAWVQPLPGGPNGIFMESRRPTQVATSLIVVQKPGAGGSWAA